MTRPPVPKVASGAPCGSSRATAAWVVEPPPLAGTAPVKTTDPSGCTARKSPGSGRVNDTPPNERPPLPMMTSPPVP